MARADDDEEFAEYAVVALPRLRRIAFLLCEDRHRADDLAQSALTRTYVHWHRARAAENRDAYVGAILMNVFLGEQRTAWWRRTTVHASPELAMPEAQLSAGEGISAEELLDLRSALRMLPPRQRAVIVLRYYCDYSIEQTAQVLGCTAGTVKSQTSKALLRLRGILIPLHEQGHDSVEPSYGVQAAVPSLPVKTSITGREL